jgi:hypothetical protein
MMLTAIIGYFGGTRFLVPDKPGKIELLKGTFILSL